MGAVQAGGEPKMRTIRILGLTAALMMGVSSVASAQGLKTGYDDVLAGSPTIKAGYEFKKPKAVISATDTYVDAGGAALPEISSGGMVALGFEGISQYDTSGVARNFIPPDTMGAVGASQYMEFVNGGVAVFDKATGTRTSFSSDTSWWNSVAGQAGVPNGDQRVMYNTKSDRWIALSFGSNAKDIQIAVSDTSNALGSWKSTKYEGYAGFGFGSTADYPTLAMDLNAVYIGTNNFAPKTSGGTNSFRGTTLSVIPLASLFNAVSPTTTGLVKFETPYDSSSSSNDFSRGFAIQGVNSNEVTTTGNILAVSLATNELTRYDILGAGTAGALRTAGFNVGGDYTSNSAGRQPAVGSPGNGRVVDTLDDRVSSSVWEVGGRIYSVHTVTEIGTDYTVVRYNVIDSITGAVLDEGDIGGGGFDYYQGSLAVNEFGQVVVAYNRSGSVAGIGKISFMARVFTTDGTGKLVASGSELLLHTSLVDDYHNGSVFGSPAAGRQRWGDYSSVTLDPTNSLSFWAIGEFAREYNNAAGGHPGGTGGSRWSTWISQITIPGGAAVPEPATWAMMILGFGLIGVTARRRRSVES